MERGSNYDNDTLVLGLVEVRPVKIGYTLGRRLETPVQVIGLILNRSAFVRPKATVAEVHC